MLTADEAARRLGISARTVRLAAMQGRLPGAARHGWMWMIPEEGLQAFKRGVGGWKKGEPRGKRMEKR